MMKQGKSQDAEAERVDLRLLAADVRDAAQGLGVRPSGLLTIIAPPVGDFVAEESLAYFGIRNREKELGSLDGTLLEEFRLSLKKVRARLKLFDDNDSMAPKERGHGTKTVASRARNS